MIVIIILVSSWRTETLTSMTLSSKVSKLYQNYFSRYKNIFVLKYCFDRYIHLHYFLITLCHVPGLTVTTVTYTMVTIDKIDSYHGDIYHGWQLPSVSYHGCNCQGCQLIWITVTKGDSYHGWQLPGLTVTRVDSYQTSQTIFPGQH